MPKAKWLLTFQKSNQALINTPCARSRLSFSADGDTRNYDFPTKKLHLLANITITNTNITAGKVFVA